MTFFHHEISNISLYIFCSIVLAFIIIIASRIVSTGNPDLEKLSAYECGFDPYEDARNNFDVRFYLVAILFIIFDLEIMFLFPWAVTLGNIGSLGFWSMMVFLGILTIGFIYEWSVCPVSKFP